jgi:hypothetical protein
MPEVENTMRRATLLILLSASLLASPVSPLAQIWSLLASLTSPAPTIDAGS